MNYDCGTPFLIVADPRTGGTFLSTCLGSHPDIYCHRKEVLHPRDTPRQVVPRLAPLQLARIFLEQQAWEACGIKLIYKQVAPVFLRYIQEEDGVLIFLERKNAIRVAISREATRQYKEDAKVNYPYTRREPGRPNPIAVEANRIIQVARTYRARTQQMHDRLRDEGIPYKHILYEEMLDPDDPHRMDKELGYELCARLGASKRVLRCKYYPSAPVPLSEFIINWVNLRDRIMNSELTDCLEGEEGSDVDGTEGEGVEESPPPVEDTEPGVGQPYHTWSYQPRSFTAPTGDLDSVGPE